MSDVAVRHAVAVNTFSVHHSIDISPSVVSIAKEIRYCVLAVVIGYSVTSIFRSVWNSRRTPGQH